MRRVLLAGAALALLTGADTPPEAVMLDIVLTGLRSGTGEVRVCLWHEGLAFPNCKRGHDVQKLAIAAAAPSVTISVPDLRPGSYAISVIHDENGNRLLDKSVVGMPTEGIGFSNNPRLMFGPPKYAQARFDAVADTQATIRMKYYL
jgi:uncharacterized protein (DUF2141 family)